MYLGKQFVRNISGGVEPHYGQNRAQVTFFADGKVSFARSSFLKKSGVYLGSPKSPGTKCFVSTFRCDTESDCTIQTKKFRKYRAHFLISASFHCHTFCYVSWSIHIVSCLNTHIISQKLQNNYIENRAYSPKIR